MNTLISHLVINRKNFPWIFGEASSREIGCTKMMIYLTTITHMIWLSNSLILNPDDAINYYQKKIAGLSELFLNYISVQGSQIYAFAIVVCIFTGLIYILAMLLKDRSLKKIRSRERFRVLTVALLAYCQYRFIVDRCIECNVGVIEYTANYLLSAIFIFSIIPAMWMNIYMAFAFYFFFGFLAILPIYILLSLFSFLAYRFYRNNSSIINGELDMLNTYEPLRRQ